MQTTTTKDSVVKNIGVNSKMSNKVDKKSEAIADDFRNLITETEGLLKATAELGGAELTLARAKLNERLVQARHN